MIKCSPIVMRVSCEQFPTFCSTILCAWQKKDWDQGKKKKIETINVYTMGTKLIQVVVLLNKPKYGGWLFVRLSIFLHTVRLAMLHNAAKTNLKSNLIFVQLNRYETTPYFFLLNQNLTCDCLMICGFFPEFTWSETKIVLNIKTE